MSWAKSRAGEYADSERGGHDYKWYKKMRINAEWSQKDIETVKQLWTKHGQSNNQQWVCRFNLTYPWNRPSDATIWDTKVACVVSSVQPSGPNSSLAALFDTIGTTDFPLGLAQIAEASDPVAFISNTLRERGFRFGNRRASMIWANHERFVTSERCTILEATSQELITTRSGQSMANGDELLRQERAAAKEMMWGKKAKIIGMGPKQSRHLLKQVGLGSESVVIDSRLMRFLWSVLESPDEAGPDKLNEEYTYRMVENWFRTLACQVGIAPIQLETLLWEVYVNKKPAA